MKLAINGIHLNVHDQGDDGPAFVFLHYWGGSRRTWSDVIHHLGASRRCVALDFRGWGDSDGPLDGYRIRDLADDVRVTIETLKLEHYVLVGHSMGGKVAQLVASWRPAGLVGLVLVAPSPAGGVHIPDEQREAMLHAYDSPASVEATLDRILTAHPLAGERRRRAVEDSLRGAAAAKAAWPASSLGEDVSSDLARIAVPTTVLGGELDVVDPIAMLERDVVARIAGSELHAIAGAGHLLPLEAPEAIAAQLDAFLAKRITSMSRVG